MKECHPHFQSHGQPCKDARISTREQHDWICLQRLWCEEKIRGEPEQAGGDRKLGHACYSLSKRVAVWSQAVVVEMRRVNGLGAGGGYLDDLLEIKKIFHELHDQDEGEGTADLQMEQLDRW